MKRVLVIVVLVVIVAAIIGAVTGSGSDGTKPSNTSSGVSGATEGNFSTAVTDAPKWPAFRGKCQEPAIHLASEVTFAYQDLQRHDEGESYDDLVTHLNHSIPGSLGVTDCTSIIAAYLTIREG